jgi:F-type H+-transporting ATPase subunit delta
VIRSRVAIRYARALFEVALENKQLELVETDLGSLKESYEKSQEFSALVDSPVISTEAKQQAFSVSFKKRLQDITFRFVTLLISKNREMLLMQIVEEFGDLLDQHRGIVRGDIYSVTSLSEEQIKNLVAQLNRMTGKNVLITRHLDESLLGGIVIKLQDKVFDASLRNKLEKLRQNLIEA